MDVPRVLVVEDERIVAAGLRKRLQSLGYDVPVLAHSGEDAIALTEQTRPNLVLMDIRLEGEMDGIEDSASRIRSRYHIPVIYLTAYSNKEVLDRAKVTEPYGYILKPYQDRELHVVVETALYRHRAERSLEERERWQAAVLKSIGDGVLTTDQAGLVTFLNTRAEQLTGWTSAEAAGRSLQEVFRALDEERRQPVQVLQGARSKEQGVKQREGASGPMLRARRSMLLVARDGTDKPIESQTAPIAGDETETLGWVVVFRDLSERRLLEEELLQAQKMEAIGRLAGGVAHDFNNLLTVINCYSEVLLRTLPREDKAREHVVEIGQAAGRAANLTQQLLAYSRKQVVQPRVLSVNDLVAGMKKMLGRMIGEDIELSTTLASDLWPIRADPGQVEQILMNLCLNARDAMPTGGKLTIATANVPLAEPTLSTEAKLPPGRYVLITVADTGCGMDAGTRAQIFRPFFTTKKDKGIGLGLALVEGIINQAGGAIRVHSDPGQGTTFTIHLPIIEEAQGEQLAPGDEAVPGGTETILLAEDEEVVRAITHLLLCQLGYQVLVAANGVEALEAAGRHQGPIDLLLTDVVMPRMDGRQLADALLQDRPDVQVLFLSGYTEDALVRRGIVESETPFIQKPFTTAALARKVRELLDNE